MLVFALGASINHVDMSILLHKPYLVKWSLKGELRGSKMSKIVLWVIIFTIFCHYFNLVSSQTKKPSKDKMVLIWIFAIYSECSPITCIVVCVWSQGSNSPSFLVLKLWVWSPKHTGLSSNSEFRIFNIELNIE